MPGRGRIPAATEGRWEMRFDDLERQGVSHKHIIILISLVTVGEGGRGRHRTGR